MAGDEWHFGGRYYGVTWAGSPDSMDAELDDLAPAPERGTVARVASPDDRAIEPTFVQYEREPLPQALVEKFVQEARRGQPSAQGQVPFLSVETHYPPKMVGL